MNAFDSTLVLFVVVKGAALLGVAWIAAVLLRQQRAALRHAVWVLALLAQLVIVSLALYPAAAVPLPVPIPKLALPEPAPAPVPPRAETVPPRAAAESASARSRIDPATIVFRVWAFGALLVILRLVVGTVQIARIAMRSRRVVDPALLSDLQRGCTIAGITRPVTLLESPRVALPVTWGFVYPTILVPSSATAWSDRERKHVLLHELGHVRRLDALSQVAGQFALAVFWFQPLVWLAVRRLGAEAENACDDFILRAGEKPSAYATTLVGLARGVAGEGTPAFASLSIGRSDLEKRIEALTAPGREAAASGRARLLPALAAVAAVVLPLAAVQPERDAVATAAADRGAVARTKADSIPCRALYVGSMGFSETSGRLTRDDGVTVHYFFLRPEPGRCLEASFSLDARFTADDAGLEPTRGLAALVHETTGAGDRAVWLEERNGAIERRYAVDGMTAAWDGAAEAWFRGVLPDVIRRTSAGVDVRARRIVDRGGVDALDAELDAIPALDVRRDYLVALLAIRDGNELSRTALIERARALLGAYQPAFAEFLSALAEREADDEDVLRAVLDAVPTLDAGSERVAVLSAMARHSSPAVRVAAMESIGLVAGDSWRRTFLESSAPWFLGGSPRLVDAWLGATRRLEKAAERRELLRAVSTRELPPEVVGRLNEELAAN